MQTHFDSSPDVTGQPPRPTALPLVGVLVVDKPLGWSSMDVIRRLRRGSGRKLKAGHAGTLDPLATGVVVCCIGRQATRLVDQIMDLPKTYIAQIDLTAFTTTDDREGERQEVATANPPTSEQVQAVLAQFVGMIQQTPPAYSAIHVAGKRAYQLARQGQHVELKPRTVRVDGIDLLSYAWPILEIEVRCGKGTYIRSLARDIGQALGTGGHLAALRRTAVGHYDLTTAVPGSRLEQPLTQADLLAVPSAG